MIKLSRYCYASSFYESKCKTSNDNDNFIGRRNSIITNNISICRDKFYKYYYHGNPRISFIEEKQRFDLLTCRWKFKDEYKI